MGDRHDLQVRRRTRFQFLWFHLVADHQVNAVQRHLSRVLSDWHASLVRRTLQGVNLLFAQVAGKVRLVADGVDFLADRVTQQFQVLRDGKAQVSDLHVVRADVNSQAVEFNPRQVAVGLQGNDSHFTPRVSSATRRPAFAHSAMRWNERAAS